MYLGNLRWPSCKLELIDAVLSITARSAQGPFAGAGPLTDDARAPPPAVRVEEVTGGAQLGVKPPKGLREERRAHRSVTAGSADTGTAGPRWRHTPGHA
ncbi:hypothetical protein EVAR_83738_1 [Eumeta japonica]|uniref:Uncharacterized protein n=1 Tax=Eumeta variegata TaxID=151549 RepID=A0A4C1WD36_EUMVA|nr:hypothetical protein EVAR_83738_1 [Eumeta japonica]